MLNEYIEALKKHGVSNVGSYNTTKNLVEIKTQLYNKLNKLGLANYRHQWQSSNNINTPAIKNYVMKLDQFIIEIYELTNHNQYQVTLYSNQLIPYEGDEHKYLLEIYNQLII